MRNTTIPILKRINGLTLNGIHWQQDGAKVHMTKYLDGKFRSGMFASDEVQGVE